MIISIFLSFYSFKYLTYDLTQDNLLHKSIGDRILRNVGKIITGILIILFFYWLFVKITTPIPLPPPTEEQTKAQVEKIHNTKITMDDVLGKNLPPRPKDPDATVEGYDVNNNGIRDDIELDIFEAYPNSQKTRAVLLQYALTQQMTVSQPFLNKETVTAVAIEDSRAYRCVSNRFSSKEFSSFSEEEYEKAWDFIDELQDFIKKRQNNTKAREKAVDNFYQGNLSSYTLPNGRCDIDLSILPN